MKNELRQEIKALRIQMARLEENAKAREDKLLNLIFTLEPFFNALTPQMHDAVMAALDD